MIHKRIITLEGPEEWIKTTLRNSLKEGVTDKIFGDGKSIMVETIEGEPIIDNPLINKPEVRFDKNNV